LRSNPFVVETRRDEPLKAMRELIAEYEVNEGWPIAAPEVIDTVILRWEDFEVVLGYVEHRDVSSDDADLDGFQDDES
jgi:hypothetical protein